MEVFVTQGCTPTASRSSLTLGCLVARFQRVARYFTIKFNIRPGT